jgi:hypothetical protein
MDPDILIRSPDPEPGGPKRWLKRKKIGKQVHYIWRARFPKLEGLERPEITQNRIFM